MVRVVPADAAIFQTTNIFECAMPGRRLFGRREDAMAHPYAEIDERCEFLKS
jgi:hypothetical protein